MQEGDEERARRLQVLSNATQQLDRHCGDTPALQLSSYQTHGLVTDWSHWNEKRDIHFVGH